MRFEGLAVSWPSRTEAPDGRTSPEELLASAHASCFAMQLSAALGQAGTPPQTLRVSAEVTFDRVGSAWTVVSSALRVHGKVPTTDEVTFKRAAEGAKDDCPISRALKGNVQLSVEATLEK
jgi:osmotically inducible protein OsmC